MMNTEWVYSGSHRFVDNEDCLATYPGILGHLRYTGNVDYSVDYSKKRFPIFGFVERCQ